VRFVEKFSAADEIDEVAVASIVLLCVTHVYDVAIEFQATELLAEHTILFAHVAGANKQ
tara:strand:+ start:492 stop:668 length:177 start_codon:yes stop_codon:yes gene_type:complete